jgi:hypothetical protein
MEGMIFFWIFLSLYRWKVATFNLGTSVFLNPAVSRRDFLAKRPVMTCREIRASIHPWMSRRSTFHDDLHNCGDLTSPRPVHDDRCANRNRETELALHPRKMFWNTNLCVIFVISASLSRVVSYTRAISRSEHGPRASASLSAKCIPEKARFGMYLDYKEVDNTIHESKPLLSMTHTFSWQLDLRELNSEKLARSWNPRSEDLT